MRLISDDALATATVWAEARGETDWGKLGVAECIRNRAQECYQGGPSIASVVLRPFAFSCWLPDDPNFRPMLQIDDDDPVVQACAEAWAKAKAGSNIARGALHYLNEREVLKTRGKLPGWVAKCVGVATIGNHEFYRPRDMLSR